MEKQIKTNFDVLMSCQSPEQFTRMYEQVFGYGCMQIISQKNGMYKEVWKKHCLLPEYRGVNGCDKCKLEFWKKEYEEASQKLAEMKGE